MNAKPWDPAGQARRALQGIAADPQYGAAALSQPAVMSNLLKDFLPDEPREASLLVAAAQADLAGSLRGYVAQGLDAATAVNLTANSFVNSTSHTQEACAWVVGELALALGIDPAAAPQQAAAPPGPPPGQPTLAAAVNAGFAQGPPPYSPQGQVQGPWGTPASPWQQQSPWAPPRPAGPASPGSVAAGVCGFIGALLVLVGCLAPLSRYPGQPSFGIFFGHIGTPTSETVWFAAEPVGVLLVAIVAGIGLVAPGNRPRAKTVFQGMLVAFGIQTLLLFAGYAFTVYPPAKHEAGGYLGILGALVLLLGGVIGLARGAQQPTAAAAATATPPGAGPTTPGG